MPAQTVAQPEDRRSSPTSSKYAPIAELGRGGMATALLSVARGPRGFNKLVVVKRLRPALASEPEFLRMFLDEARLAARIDHPNVVQTFEVGVDNNECFIAMEFVDGQPFENIWRRAKRAAAKSDSLEAIEEAAGVPLHLSLHVIGLVLDALEFAHNLKDFDGTPLNVVHRDVSPHNVMVTYEGHVKLLDFGIAKAADSTTETRTGVIKGKCGYMAPEQFGGGDVDRRADVFAAGVMLWQALTGRKMWRGLSDVEVFQRLAQGQVPLPSSVVVDVDPALEAICMKALAPAVAERYASAAELRSDLDDYLAQHLELSASPRELGRYVSDLFGNDRRKIHALIETQVAKKADDDVEGLMNLSEYFGNSGTRKTAADDVKATPTSAPSRSRWRVPFAVIGVFVVAGVAVGAVYGRAQTSQTIAPAVAAAKAELLVHVTPPDARVSLDGVGLTGSPPGGIFTLDHAEHHLFAAAPGYVSRSDVALLDSDRVTVDMTLDPMPPSTASSVGAATTAHQQVVPRTRGAGGRARHTESTAEAAATTAPPAAPTVSEAPPAPPPPSPTRAFPTGPNLDKSDPWAQSSGKP